MLEPKVRLAVVTGKTIPVIPAGFSDVFVYIPGARQLVCILENRPDKKSAQSISVPIQELDNAGILGRLQIPQ